MGDFLFLCRLRLPLEDYQSDDEVRSVNTEERASEMTVQQPIQK
jgi:hypothetical protein